MSMQIELLDGVAAFAPGEPIDGVVSWSLERPPRDELPR